MIQFEEITLSFSTGKVFSNLSFSVEEGGHVCISGPSGSGKSSVLKIIQGYILPDKGNVKINRTSLNKNSVKELRSIMTYVPQNINLPVTSGDELLKLLGAGNKRENTGRFLQNLGLEKNMVHRPFDEMSGGQKQRIVISVCLSLDRDVILLDEPTSSLDEESIQNLIRVINDLEGKTIVSASHNQMWIESVDKVVAL
ncbi:ATP-binding cassette domain-containing protein [Marinilabilia sp.]|uniref:ATP-binding cassette domain-containing protein n=1 Tax=Marinilabilia sp. TaxID=2021252 RepID=UPI0025C70276|nr:ATP-binding cassette domain-containing protein [Marinilabilia sp.]